MGKLGEIKFPQKLKLMLCFGFWMMIVGIFWQHFWKFLIPNILILRPKWELALEIEMNISAFNWLNYPESPSEVGPYTFRQENVYDDYARNYVIRPKFKGNLRKKFFCTSKCTNLHTDTISIPNDALKDFQWNAKLSDEAKAMDVTSEPQNLNLISLASNIDIFDREIITSNHNTIDFSADGIGRTVTLFLVPESENLDGILGHRYTSNRTQLLNSNDKLSLQSNYLNLSRNYSFFPLLVEPPNISILVEPTFNYIMSAQYDLQFYVKLPHQNNTIIMPLLKICQRGSMIEYSKMYFKQHLFFESLGRHFCWKIFLILGILIVFCTILLFWQKDLDTIIIVTKKRDKLDKKLIKNSTFYTDIM